MKWLIGLVAGNPGTLIYLAIGIAVAAGAAGGTAAWKFQGMRLDSAKAATVAVQAKFDVFVAQVAAEGKVAQQRADTQAAADKLRAKEADDENKHVHALDSQRIASLRHDLDSRSNGLPAVPAGSSRPDLLCLDRAEYQREDGAAFVRLRQGARGLADEGTAATLDLNTTKMWAKH